MVRNILLALAAGAAVGLMYRYLSNNGEVADFIEEAEDDTNAIARAGKRAVTSRAGDMGEAIGREISRRKF